MECSNIQNNLFFLSDIHLSNIRGKVKNNYNFCTFLNMKKEIRCLLLIHAKDAPEWTAHFCLLFCCYQDLTDHFTVYSWWILVSSLQWTLLCLDRIMLHLGAGKLLKYYQYNNFSDLTSFLLPSVSALEV